jgi:hypothetical protein
MIQRLIGISCRPLASAWGSLRRTDELPMNRVTAGLSHATETPRARRIREAQEREELFARVASIPLNPRRGAPQRGQPPTRSLEAEPGPDPA